MLECDFGVRGQASDRSILKSGAACHCVLLDLPWWQFVGGGDRAVDRTGADSEIEDKDAGRGGDDNWVLHCNCPDLFCRCTQILS